MQRLTVSLRGGCDKQENCLLFRFIGQLDAYSDKQFSAFVQEAREGVALPLVLDLSRIDFLDSSGLGALVQLAKECQRQDIQFVLVGSPRVIQTVKLVRLEQFLHVQPTLELALDTLAAA